MSIFLKKQVRDFLQTLVLSTQLCLKNELMNHAGAAAFFCLLSILPVILLLVFLFDFYYLQQFPSAQAYFFSFLESIDGNFDRDLLAKIGLLKINASGLGLFGLINLLWAGRWILTSIQRGLGAVFHTKKARTPLVTNVLSFLVLFCFLILIVAGTLVSMWLEYVVPLIADNLTGRNISVLLLPFARNLFLFTMTLLCIFLTFRFLPANRPGTGSSIRGATLCALTILLIHLLFFKFFNISQYSTIYGALASLVLTALWIHFSFISFFFFAQYTYVVDNLDVLLLAKMYHVSKVHEAKKSKFLFKQPDRILDRYAKRYEPGDILFKEGEAGTDVFYVMAGSVGIYEDFPGEKRKIAAIGQDELFGEMAYLLEEKRKATAVAETVTFVLVFKSEMFEELLQLSRTISRDLIRLLCSRIRLNTPSGPIG